MNLVDYASKKNQQRIRHIMNDDIRICGCGTDYKYRLLRAMLERAEEHQVSFYKPLGELCGEGVEFVAHVMDGWKLLEHGSSVGGAWLTENGKILLQFFRDFGTDSETWPDWWCSCGVDEKW